MTIEGAEKEEATRAIPAAPGPLPLPPPLSRAPLPTRPVRPGVIAMGSVAGAAFLLGSAFGLRALAINPGADARTGPGVTIADLQAEAHTAHADAMVADATDRAGYESM